MSEVLGKGVSHHELSVILGQMIAKSCAGAEGGVHG